MAVWWRRFWMWSVVIPPRSISIPKNHADLVTVSLNLSYVAAARQGVITARARPTGGGKSIAYIFGELFDDEGRLLATANGIFKRIRK